MDGTYPTIRVLTQEGEVRTFRDAHWLLEGEILHVSDDDGWLSSFPLREVKGWWAPIQHDA